MKKIIFTFIILLLAIQTLSAQEQKQSNQKKPLICSDCYPVNRKAIDLPKPLYSLAARAVNAHGEVQVQIVINENGNVESAEPKSGHPLLWAESVKAALKAKFEPFLIGGKPIKAIGLIVYNFLSNEPNQPKQIEIEPKETIIPKGKTIVNIGGGIVIGKEIKLVKPPSAFCNCAFGKGKNSVLVQTDIDEKGNVVKATAISGHPFLKKSCEKAAQFSKFAPSLNSGVRVKVKALIEYTFTSKGKWKADFLNVVVKEIKLKT